MKEGMTEQVNPSGQKGSSDNSEDDYEDEENMALKHDLHLDSPSKHHYIVGAKSLNNVMQ
eukprot:CAMPEP_0197003056 /NCGR_PEP_ID=MMETSP1380-20130617/7433_1 /TAXON_ID=5936 /ORGANISM="Euplotes crassus, Strain CT5" /LENGTH=59 /DNA_ID=CAMNT_0042421443 /DNA_START=31 /DNA_END=210 /DNA_ORIENTATION=-